jgi:heme-degrading monooxygenase HmoA
MHARVSTYRAPVERADEAVSAFENAVASLRDMEGIRDAYLLIDRSSGKAVTITLWESEEAVRASSEAADRVRGEATQAYGGSIESVETYEVAMHESFGGALR